MRVRRGAVVGAVGALVGAVSMLGAPGVAVAAGGAVPHTLSAGSTTSLPFVAITLGTYEGPSTFTLTSTTATTFDISTDISFTGTGADDYVVLADGTACPGLQTDNTTIDFAASGAGASCVMDTYFFPGDLGDRSATMSITNGPTISLSGSGTIGYYQVDSSGTVAYAGDAVPYGDIGGAHLNKPIVGIEPTGDNGGYWLVASDGGIFNYGDAAFLGSTGGLHLNQPIVGMTRSADGAGYWLVASDGGIFAYGDAAFFGSTGSIHLNKPIVGMAPTPTGNGYWLVASDGGIFAYGDANFFGSTGSTALNKPIVGMAPTPTGNGYWLVASDGGIFAYGDANFFGSTGSIHLNKPIVAMAAMPTGNGYWFSAADGGVFNYGDAPFYGSGVGTGLGTVVDMATDGGPTIQAQFGIPALRQAHLRGRGAAGLALPHFVRH